MSITVKNDLSKQTFSMLEQEETVEMYLAALWVAEETLKLVELILVIVETLDEKDPVVVEVVVADIAMEV